MRDISIVVAMSENRVIGIDNTLPWHLSADLKRFKEITTGHCIIMGRLTFESIGKALPNRLNIVISRNKDLELPENVLIANSLENAIEVAEQEGKKIFIIGGGQIFNQALPICNKLYLTVVHKEINGDVYFPSIKMDEWNVNWEEKNLLDIKSELKYSFIDLERKAI